MKGLCWHNFTSHHTTAWNRSLGWRSRKSPPPHAPSDFDRSTSTGGGGGSGYAPRLLRNPPDVQIFQRHCLWSMQNAEPSLIRSRVFFSSSSFHTCTGELGVSKFSYIYFWPIFRITCYIEDFSRMARKFLILDFISTTYN